LLISKPMATGERDAGTFNGKLRRHPAEAGFALGTAILLGIGTAGVVVAGRRPKPSKRQLVTGAAATSAGVAATFVLLDALLTHRRVTRLDRHLHNYFRQHRTKREERFVDATTVTGNGWFIAPLALLTASRLIADDDSRLAMTVLWSVAGAGIWSEAIKRVVRRERPPEGREESRDFSFPSGHTLFAGSFYGLLAYIVWTRKSLGTWRFPAAAALASIAPWTAFSRMYLGRHWPSDTAASAALATAWNATLITFLRSGESRRD
jgi:undecaprenyl-diphosphatase